jgi:hypothetical protein
LTFANQLSAVALVLMAEVVREVEAAREARVLAQEALAG